MNKFLGLMSLFLIFALVVLMPTNSMYKDCIFAYKENELGLTSKSAILMDEASGKIIFEHNADAKVPVASMTKTMTILLTLESASEKRITLDDTTIITEHAASQEGSECFLDANKSYRVYDLLRAVIISSANDASVALAEHISGTEDIFVKYMNKRAEELGLTSTVFKNSTGLYVEGAYSTVRDISKIMKELAKHQTYMQISMVWMDQLLHDKGRVTELTNTNRLLKSYKDCDAGKTGFTDESKYCLVATAKRGGTRLISCLAGADSTKTRFDETIKLFNYGFSNFESKKIVDKNKTVGEVLVKGGKSDSVAVYPQRDIYSLEKRGVSSEITTKVFLEEKYTAPMLEDQVVGKVEIYSNNVLIEECDLVIKETISKLKYKDTLKDVIQNFRGF